MFADVMSVAHHYHNIRLFGAKVKGSKAIFHREIALFIYYFGHGLLIYSGDTPAFAENPDESN
jgi:hypothetical protein